MCFAETGFQLGMLMDRMGIDWLARIDITTLFSFLFCDADLRSSGCYLIL